VYLFSLTLAYVKVRGCYKRDSYIWGGCGACARHLPCPYGQCYHGCLGEVFHNFPFIFFFLNKEGSFAPFIFFKNKEGARINFIYPWVAHASHPIHPPPRLASIGAIGDRSIRKRFKERACSLLVACKPLSFVPKVLAIRDSFLIFLIPLLSGPYTRFPCVAG